MILKALDMAGGETYLHAQSAVNPAAFMQLVGKVLPTQTQQLGADGEPVDPRPDFATFSATWRGRGQ